MKFVNLVNKFFYLTSRTYLIVKKYKFDKSLNYVWGMKKSGLRFRGKVDNSKLVYIEDGFVHSFGLNNKKIPLSICYDRNGIYYKYDSESELFTYIQESLSNQNLLRSKMIIKLWKKYSVSKYNFPDFIDPPHDKCVLLIDQTLGDLSISYGGASQDSFSKMFHFASENWPDHKIVIKLHPDVVTQKKVGCLDNTFFLIKMLF